MSLIKIKLVERFGSNPRRSPSLTIVNTVVLIICFSFLGFFFLFPIIKLIFWGLTGDFSSSGDNFWSLLLLERTWKILGSTIFMALTATFVSVILGIPGAYTFYCLKLPGAKIIKSLITVPFVLPSVVVGVAFNSMFSPSGPWGFLHLANSPFAVIIAMVFFNYSLVVRVVGATWSRLDNRNAQAAATLGASPIKVFFSVILPALWPSIISVASLVFLYCTSSFALVRMLGGVNATTLEAEIYLETAQYLNLSGAAGLSIMQIFVVALALLLSGYFASRQDLGTKGNFGNKATVQNINSRNILVFLFTVATVGILIIWPLAKMIFNSLKRDQKFSWQNFIDLALPVSNDLLPNTVLQATGNSIFMAFIAAGIAITIGVSVSFLLASATTAPSGKWRSMVDVVFMLPLGVSAVTVGFGLLITLQAPPFNLGGSWLLIVMSQAIVAMPLVIRVVLPLLRAIDSRQYEVCQCLGASPLRSQLFIRIPILANGIKSSFGFAFAISLGEFGATSFLTRPDWQTLPISMYTLMSKPDPASQGMAQASAVLLAILCLIVMFFSEYSLKNKENR